MVYLVRQLQSVLNVAARLTYHLRRSDRISDARRLHCLCYEKSVLLSLFVGTKNNDLLVLQQNVEVVPREKNV